MAKAKNSGKTLTEPLYYITNQYNLREILAGGFIGTRASFDNKYYKDLLEESSGRIPLFTLPLEPSLIRKVNEHDPETSFAVVLQVYSAGLDSSSSELIKEGEKDVCVAYAGVISLKSVSAIHFLSAENRGEFEARSYSNMPRPQNLYKVSPNLVGTDGHIPDIFQRLKDIPALSHPTRGNFSSLDRISGAISLCIYKSEGKEQSNQLLKLLEPRKKQQKTSDKLPAWFDLGLEKKSKEDIVRLTDINELVFTSTISVLYDYNLNSVSQREKILERIKATIYSHPKIEEYKETLDRSFTKIQRLFRLEDDFEPFRSSPGSYDAIRALLLFLMRPQHKELLAWSSSETNASQPVILTALVYSGIVIGRKGLDTEYRPADTKIVELIVEALNRMAQQNKKTAQPPTYTGKKKAPGKEISSVDWNLMTEKMLNDKKDEPEFIDSAVQLCREKGWRDCVTTVVTWSAKEKFQLESGQKAGLTLRLSGFPEITHELHVEQFTIRLASLTHF